MKWWAYKHVDGSLQLKRYFDILDITEAKRSPFVAQTYGPFSAETREEAIKRMQSFFGGG